MGKGGRGTGWCAYGMFQLCMSDLYAHARRRYKKLQKSTRANTIRSRQLDLETGTYIPSRARCWMVSKSTRTPQSISISTHGPGMHRAREAYTHCSKNWRTCTFTYIYIYIQGHEVKKIKVHIYIYIYIYIYTRVDDVRVDVIIMMYTRTYTFYISIDQRTCTGRAATRSREVACARS
jgi:hypothetical protein